MNTKKIQVSLVFLLSLFFLHSHAQQTIPASGGEGNGSGGSISYTVGQVAYTTNTGTNGSVTAGVQQPFEISETIGIEEAKSIVLNWIIYPNPTVDFLNIDLGSYKSDLVIYQLFDSRGRLLQKKRITDKQTTIDVSSLSSAIYYLKISGNNQEVKSFKVIKNK